VQRAPNRVAAGVRGECIRSDPPTCKTQHQHRRRIHGWLVNEHIYPASDRWYPNVVENTCITIYRNPSTGRHHSVDGSNKSPILAPIMRLVVFLRAATTFSVIYCADLFISMRSNSCVVIIQSQNGFDNKKIIPLTTTMIKHLHRITM